MKAGGSNTGCGRVSLTSAFVVHVTHIETASGVTEQLYVWQAVLEVMPSNSDVMHSAT